MWMIQSKTYRCRDAGHNTKRYGTEASKLQSHRQRKKNSVSVIGKHIKNRRELVWLDTFGLEKVDATFA